MSNEADSGSHSPGGSSGFSAVRTTGIYCRPGCSARPDQRNVQTYALQAAAEASGFRACHLCRPYRVEPAAPAAGTELVCRAITMITDGILDDRTEAELAGRLGVSPRHLRRLFLAEVGVTPDQLARSRRAHFARRLLDDTDLPITEVAFAAGFGSVRQFNRVCRDVFRCTPGELRTRRRRSERPPADGGLRMRLNCPADLDWPALLRRLSHRLVPGVDAIEGQVYRRTITLEGDPGVLLAGVIELEVPVDDGGDPHMLLTAHLPRWEGLIHVVHRARAIASLDLDLEPAIAFLSNDPLLGSRIQGHRMVRPPGAWDPFEVGVRTIVGQQVSTAAAATITGRIVARHGTAVQGWEGMGLTYLFPTPEALEHADFDGLGMTRTKGSAIRAFAAGVVADRIRLDGSVSLATLQTQLMSMDGLGAWTANYLALQMGELDAFPASDLGLRRGAARLTADRSQPSPPPPMGTAELSKLAEAWRPWRAVAATHLWDAASAP